ncbi:hypothetical protein B0H11DRAFT_2231042 [Mycena galericulata]|nr:hypothetical protein B0H11DRAFT_2231042 [Mycena galericulata]
MGARGTNRGSGTGSGRGSRGGRGGRGAKNPAVGTKRSAPVDADYEDAPPKAKRKTAPVEPRTLPERENRGSNPTRVEASEIHATRPRRPNGAGAADQAEKIQRAENLELRRQAAIAMLAAINAEQDEDAAAEEESTVYDLHDLPASDDAMDLDPAQDEDEPILSITQDDFARIEDEGAYLSESEFDKPKASTLLPPPIAKAAPTKRAKKPEKGATRAEIDAMTTKIVAEKSKPVQDSNAAAVSKKAGVSQTWIQSKSKAPRPASPETAKLGGFTDDDAGGTRLELDLGAQAPRKNNLVGLVASSDADPTPSKPVDVKAKVKLGSRKPSRTSGNPERMPALKLTADSSTPQIKSESSSGSFTPDSAVDVNGLPALVAKTWTTSLLPALYRVLYLSDDPMAIGSVGKDPMNPGKETVAIIQAVLDAKYPGNTLVVEWGDAVCTKAVSRIGERRSTIGRTVVQAVDRLFESPQYYKADMTNLRKSQKILDDARYAVRNNGPAFYKNPTPENVCKLASNHPQYIKPRGYLESPLIIETLSSIIKDDDFRVIVTETTNGDKYDFSGLPAGALAMVAAAVERAYKMHFTGVRVKAPDFSLANYGTAVAGFIKSIQGFQRSRWESIIKSCGSQIIEGAAAAPADNDLDSLDGVREHMYIPSSPW